VSPEPAQRVVLIGNPAAGRGAGAAALRAVVALLRERGRAPEVLASDAPGGAVALARGAATAGAALLLAIGGDGTVRDVAEGLADAPHAPPVGIVPVGTGNDLARALGIPRAPGAAVETALSGAERRLDVWRWNRAAFVNAAGVGLDAAVAQAVNTRFRRLRGTLAYLAGFLAVFPRFRPFPLSVAGPDAEWSGRAWLAAFGNGPCYGGGMRIAPDARPDDGLLDVVIVGDVPRRVLLAQFPRIFTGGHVRHPGVHCLRLAEARVECARRPVTLDGEIIESAPARVVRCGSLRVRVPA
jgi:YegS/Rv2252/BmrU family lipid kinase